MIIDFHSHILPAIDDGSRDLSESVEMLHTMRRQGVDCLVATPHFYPDRISLNDFLNNRERAYREIDSQGMIDIPAIRCGAEVAYFSGMGKSDLLDALCIENTNLLLLEMPYRTWTAREIGEIQRIIDTGIIPVLAHIERYHSVQRNKSVFREIMQLPLYFQINSGAFTSFRKRRVAFSMVASSKNILLGSDCHNMQGRYPNLSAGRNALHKKYGDSFLSEMDALGTSLLCGNCFIKEREMSDKCTVAIAGTGYVGLSNAVLLAQHNKVFALDIVEEKVRMLNAGKSPIVDREIEAYLMHEQLDLTATMDAKQAYSGADFIIISTPTNYDEEKNYFDTSSVESAIETALSINQRAVIVIKSTIPIGYTQTVREKFQYERILFSPEFLREGRALYDNLYPSRIIVGVPDRSSEMMAYAEQFAALLSEGAKKKDIPVLFTGLQEAESIKLFANTYLAMRVSFFNELDTFAELKQLNSKEIIEGVGLDPRIGMSYNNPSFGYGGYCLPKDTKQLLANYSGVPERMIQAIVAANVTRKEYIANQIYAHACQNKKHDGVPVVGIYRLVMKSGSDNFRQSSIQDVMEILHQFGARLVVYEPTVHDTRFNGYDVENDIDAFVTSADIIVANRVNGELSSVSEKVYTRDLFSRD